MVHTLSGALERLQGGGLPLVDAALTYAQAEVAVFPCAPGGKQPLTRQGFHQATTDERQIRRWWKWQPEANIGIATGHGLEVLDIDVHETGDGYQTLERLHRLGLVQGALQAVRTPAGGVHLYFPSTSGRAQRSWSRPGAHVDFRGTGGYVIAPPSRVTVDGVSRPYEVIAVGGASRPLEGDRIRELLTPPRAGPPPRRLMPSAQEEADRIVRWLARVSEGNRNAGLFWAACRLAELGNDEASIHSRLELPARSTGLAGAEIASTVRSAWRTVQVTPDRAESAPSRGTSREPVRR